MGDRPEHVIEGGRHNRILPAIRELSRYRGTIVAFAERDIRVKYKQAVLGVGWAVLQPLAFMTIFTVTLGHLAKVSGGGVPYAAFSLSALVPWTFLQSGVSFGANALLADAALLRKVYFPREVPVFGSIASALADFGVGLAMFVIAGPLLGAKVSVTWLLVPLLALLLAGLASGVALLLAGLNIYYRDFRYALPVALQLWLFASPVAYPLSIVPKKWRGLYVVANPAAGILDSFRRVLAAGQLPQFNLLAVSTGASLIVLWTGYRVFKSLEPSFADVV